MPPLSFFRATLLLLRCASMPRNICLAFCCLWSLFLLTSSVSADRVFIIVQVAGYPAAWQYPWHLPICGLVGDVEGRNRAASGARLHLQNCKLFFRLPSKFDRLLAGEFSRI